MYIAAHVMLTTTLCEKWSKELSNIFTDFNILLFLFFYQGSGKESYLLHVTSPMCFFLSFCVLWTIMILHSFLSLVALHNTFTFTTPLSFIWSNISLIHLTNFSSRLLHIFFCFFYFMSLSVKFSRVSFLIIYPLNVIV